MIVERGRLATKLLGREAGNICAITERIDKNFVMVVGPQVRKRRCNINHLELMDTVLSVPESAGDDAFIEELTKRSQ
ncbi:MAG: 50S ribosomal protein L14e [Candidatus Methanofastidiosa archaeon]|jgi:large subunit ribosomal protein L14e|nr:50S ribosomal protein L14e [Candidatus Methanofastidiosa archaeon]MDD4280638.1 50S ribosomal protein L14e [Candidatus Methanofastidiosa archaeon]